VFRDPNIVKVFHAARQDLEIFYVDADIVPAPLFDTQIAAMVCGYGDQVGYETLVRKIARTGLDKSSRFTDWSQRPLSAAQKTYALADVTHLRQIYEYLADELQKTNRAAWVEEELSVLTDPSHYVVAPEDAWKRVKFRSSSGKTLAIIRELAQFRETYAQTKNIPRNRVFKDDALMELASTKPKNMGELSKSRLLLREARKGAIADGIIAAIARGVDMPRDDWPDLPSGPDRSAFNHALIDLLRVLLKAKSEDYGVAAKLLATASDLDDIAGGATTGPWATGWRFDVFGKDALRLARGEIALSAQKDRVAIVPV
jgi:ribonuclease D